MKLFKVKLDLQDIKDGEGINLFAREELEDAIRHVQTARELQERQERDIENKLSNGNRYRMKNKIPVLVKDTFYTE
jgi:hypothetical protein